MAVWMASMAAAAGTRRLSGADRMDRAQRNASPSNMPFGAGIPRRPNATPLKRWVFPLKPHKPGLGVTWFPKLPKLAEN